MKKLLGMLILMGVAVTLWTNIVARDPRQNRTRSAILYVDGTNYSTLAAAMAQCPLSGCTIVDYVPEAFRVNPWLSAPHGACPNVILGPGVWTTNVSLKIPCALSGYAPQPGNPIVSPTIYTSIVAGPSFPAGAPVIWETGVTGMVQNITVNCGGVIGSTGFYATDINEQAGFIDDIALGCSAYGFNVDATAYTSEPAQSYILRDLQTNSLTYGNSSTIGVHLEGNGGGGPGEVRGITAIGTVGHVIGSGVACEAWSTGTFVHIHAEQSTNVIKMLNSGCPGATLIDISGGPSTSGGQTVLNIPSTVSLGLGLNLLGIALEDSTMLINCQACSPTIKTRDSFIDQLTLGGSGTYLSTVPDIGTYFGQGVTFGGAVLIRAGIGSTKYATATNCSSSASPALCGSASAGSVTVAPTKMSVVVETTAVTKNSQILVTSDSSVGPRLGVNCDTVAQPTISARTAGRSFTIRLLNTPAVNPACVSYEVIN